MNSLFCFACLSGFCITYWTVFTFTHNFSHFYSSRSLFHPVEWSSICEVLCFWLGLKHTPCFNPSRLHSYIAKSNVQAKSTSHQKGTFLPPCIPTLVKSCVEYECAFWRFLDTAPLPILTPCLIFSMEEDRTHINYKSCENYRQRSLQVTKLPGGERVHLGPLCLLPIFRDHFL